MPKRRFGSLTSSTQVWQGWLRAHVRISKSAAQHLHLIRELAPDSQTSSRHQEPDPAQEIPCPLCSHHLQAGHFRAVIERYYPSDASSRPEQVLGLKRLSSAGLHRHAPAATRQKCLSFVWAGLNSGSRRPGHFGFQLSFIYGKDKLAKQPLLKADDSVSLHYHFPLSLAARGKPSSLYWLKTSSNGGLLC